MGSELSETKTEGFFQRPFVRRWGFFLLKAVAVIAIVAVLSLLMPKMPAVLMGITWAIISAAAALGIAYPLIMKKTSNQVELIGTGIFSRLNNGRVLRLIISFLLGAFLTTSLLFESQKWNMAQWVVILCSAPLYLLVTLLVEKIVRTQYAPMFQTKRVILISGVVTSLIMILIYSLLVALHFGELAAPESLLDAYIHTPQPFKDSSSSLLMEFGKITSFGDAICECLIRAIETESAYTVFAVVLRIILGVGAFFGITSLLGLCSLNKNEIKRIFQPLEPVDGSKKERPVLKRYVALVVVLPILLSFGFMYSEVTTKDALATDEYTCIEDSVHKIIGNVAAVEIDGRYYDRAALGLLYGEQKDKSVQIAEAAKEELTPLLNASFDARNSNVQSYIDWYFEEAPTSDNAEGSHPNPTSEQIQKYLEHDIDDTELILAYRNYAAEADNLKRETDDLLDEYKVEGVPEWLVDESIHIDSDAFQGCLKSTQNISSTYGALIGGLQEDDVDQAVGIKIADSIALRNDSSQLLEKEDDSSSNLFLDLIAGDTSRDDYENYVKQCIANEEAALFKALSVDETE